MNGSTRLIWIVANFTLACLAVVAGYGSMAADQLQHSNPDAILCVILFLTAAVFPVAAVSFSILARKQAILRRPSIDRHPLDWWGDPLQSLAVSTVVMCAATLGCALAAPTIGSADFWTLASYAGFAAGLAVGQFVVYRVFAARIVDR